MFGRVDTILKRSKNLDDDKAWRFVIDEQVQDEIVRLNTQDQLFDKGIDSLNNSLGDYSPITVIIKRRKGQKTSNITLRDTGEFYESFDVTVQRDGFTISADEMKDDTSLTEEFGIDILGLTDDSLDQVIREYILPNYRDYLLTELLRG